MRVAIVGAGGVGGYFGGVLALAGQDVTLLARGDHLAAIKANGLKIETPTAELLAPKLTAIGDAEACEPCDLVIVAVKGWQLADVMDQIQRLSHERSVILPLLNGVSATDQLRAGLSNRQIASGLCGIIAALKAPGLIHHIAVDPFITFGVNDSAEVPPEELEKIKSTFETAGVTTKISDNISLSLWRKFLFICPLSAVTSVARATIGEVRSTVETSTLLHQCIDEVIEVGNALNIELSFEHRNEVLKQIDNAPAHGTTSMQRDIVGGRHSELETQLGAVIRLGKSCNLTTPALSFIYAALLPQESASFYKNTPTN